MSATSRMIATALMVSVLGAAGWLGLLKPNLETIEVASLQETHLKEQYRTLAGLAVNLPLYRQQLLTLEERFGALISVLPGVGQLWSPEGQQEVERHIRSVASSLGLPDLTVSSGPTSYEEHIASRQYNITVAGDFRQLVQFLQGVSTGSGRLWTIQKSSLSRQENGNNLMLVVVLQTHGFVHPDTLNAWKKEQK